MSSETPTAETGEATNEQLIYAPILRDGPSERNVVQEFGGLSRFTGIDRGKFYTVLELTDEDDLDNINVYRDPADRVLVDVPSYLAQDDDNELSDSVGELLNEYGGPTEVLTQNREQVPTPVISGTLSLPMTYHQYLGLFQDVSDQFENVAIRLFFRPTEFEEDQIADLEDLEAIVDKDDIILIDLLDVGLQGEQGYENFNYLCELFGDNPRIVLNAFSSYDGVNYNFGPEIARQIGADGFGDFAINYRFPDSVPIGNVDTRTIRQYSPTESRVVEFKGNGYTGAFEELEQWERWDPNHCEFCRRANAEDTEWLPFWKRVRMGHYIAAALEQEAV
jgi:hypothetical protein